MEKKRSKNWSEGEVAVLVEEVEDKKDILKRKFSTSLTAADKASAWSGITNT
jgi:hypothetical protein